MTWIDMGLKYKWCGYEWYCDIHTKWDGMVHGYDEMYKYRDAYFGQYGVNVHPDRVELSVVTKDCQFKYPYIYPVQDKDSVTKQFCAGELCSVDTFTYGTFTWVASMPNAPELWPALWLCGRDEWPPEIDCVEGYSDKNGSYIKNCISTKLETNVHYKDNSVVKNVKASGIPTILYKLFKRKKDTWKIKWTPKHIKIYWNGIRIRYIRNRDVIDYFNSTPRMYVIMNTMVTERFSHDDCKKNKPFIVYNFKYQPIR